MNIPETRDLNKKIGYSIYELVASSFAMMYFQDPSLDYFQQKMKDSMNKSNLESMFGIKNIPKAKRIRTFLDQVDPEYFRSAFTDVLKKIDQKLQYIALTKIYPIRVNIIIVKFILIVLLRMELFQLIYYLKI